MTDGITLQQVRGSRAVEDWRLLSEGACAFFRTYSFAAGAILVSAIGELAHDRSLQR